MRIILLTKQERYSYLAREIAEDAFGSSVETFAGMVGDPEPAALSVERPDYLISFLSPWIVRQETLDRSGCAINFHPGSTDYPGTGCYNFALYERAEEFGATCHHMLAKVDTGRIILERRFGVRRTDTVETLKLRTMETMIGMFREVVHTIASGAPLPVADAHWTRPAFTRRQMNELKVLAPTMDRVEIKRRLRATIYPGYPGPAMHFPDGTVRPVGVPNRPALA